MKIILLQYEKSKEEVTQYWLNWATFFLEAQAEINETKKQNAEKERIKKESVREERIKKESVREERMREERTKKERIKKESERIKKEKETQRLTKLAYQEGYLANPEPTDDQEIVVWPWPAVVSDSITYNLITSKDYWKYFQELHKQNMKKKLLEI